MNIKVYIKTILSLIALSTASLTNAAATQITVKATAYSLNGLTSTGIPVRVGHIALSRDLLKYIPYGSKVKLTNLKGPGCKGYPTGILTVEDTMAASKYNTVDIKLASYSAAKDWGRCDATLTVVSWGRR